MASCASDKATIADQTMANIQDQKKDAINLTVPHEKENSTEKTTQDEYPHGSRLVFLVFAIILSVFLPNLDLTIVATAIPKITDEFDGLSQASWYGSAFFLTNGSSQSAWGKGYKYFSLKATFLVAIFIFELGSLICAVAPNSNAFIAGRAIAGLGAAGLSTGGFIIIAVIAPPEKRPIYTGFVGIAFGIAAVLGPLLGGVFTTEVTWRWCFYINLPVGGVAALIMLFYFRIPTSAKPAEATLKEKALQMDVVGVALMLCALLCFGLALQRGGQTQPWNSSVVIGLLIGSAAILLVFVGWERFLGDRAMIDLQTLARRQIAVNCAFTTFFTGSYFLVIYYLPIYFQSVFDDSAVLSGVHNLPLILTATAAVIVSAGIITATRRAVPVAVVGAALSTAGAGLLYTLNLHTNTGRWIGSQFLGAVGWGAALQVPIMVAQATTSPEDLPTVTAIVLFFLNMGASLLLLAAQSAFVNTIAVTLRRDDPSIDIETVIATGATQLRETFKAEDLPSILAAYMNGLRVVFAMSIAAGGIAFCVAWLNRWDKLGVANGQEAVTRDEAAIAKPTDD